MVTILRRLIFLVAVLLASSGIGVCQAPLWGDLQAGKFRVGFRSYWLSDPSRTYNYRFSDGSNYGDKRPARPILVNVWYPAIQKETGSPLHEGNYLDFVPEGQSLLSRFARDLAAKNREVIASDVMGSSATGDRLSEFLQTPTAAFRGAEPAPGQFPLAIYIQGYGSSLQDNSALCEYLASHGYVVLGGAFQDDAAKMIAGRDTVTDDVRFLVRQAREMPEVDFSKIALIGHSGGAQTSMVYASQEGSIIDAVVSLDTTQDYYFEDKQLFKSYVGRVNPDQLKAPLLVCAVQAAIFQFVDKCSKSERLYLTVDELGHDEFTSEGLASAIAQHKKTLDAVRQRYTGLCETVLQFLDAKLKGSLVPLSNPSPHFSIEAVAAGVTGPAPYVLSQEPPTPRQLRELVDRNMAKAIEAILQFGKSHPKAPIYDGQLAFAVVDHCLERGDVKSARQFAAVLKKVKGQEIVGARIYLAWGRIYTSNGFKSEAVHSFEKALMLDPANKEAKDGLAKLKDPR